jgi:transcriptional regulator with XRE-family HTH domain
MAKSKPAHSESKIESVSAGEERTVADRLRRARHLRGLTLAEVASTVGLSHNFLSMVERGASDISLSRFLRLADFYDIDAGELLSDDAFGREPQIFSAKDGLLIDRGDGVTYRLLRNSEFGIQVIHVVLAPNAGFRDHLAHAGSDIVWVIRGRLKLLYGDKEYDILSGQCVSYKGSTSHSLRNGSAEQETELVGLVTTPYW